MATAFLGYVLPYGQISLWGATVITNLLSAIPWIGTDFVQFVWGGFSVNNATLNRFFSLHYLLPFILAALAAMHLLTIHEHGSGNPLGVSGNTDRLPFHPYFTFKDLITIFGFILALSFIVFYAPNLLGHSDNYIPANPMQTPPSIVPEWYLLPFYAILRSIPNKLLGVVAMFSSLLILLVMPIVDLSRIRGSQFRPLMRGAFWLLVATFLLLMFLGGKHVEQPYILIGQVATFLYFAWFIIIVPIIGIIENTLVDLNRSSLPHIDHNSTVQQNYEPIIGRGTQLSFLWFLSFLSSDKIPEYINVQDSDLTIAQLCGKISFFSANMLVLSLSFVFTFLVNYFWYDFYSNLEFIKSRPRLAKWYSWMYRFNYLPFFALVFTLSAIGFLYYIAYIVQSTPPLTNVLEW